MISLRASALGWAALAAATAAAQPPPAGPGLPSAAPPDTATAVLAGPPHWPAPLALRLWPAEPRFGEAAALVLDFPREIPGFAADSLRVDGDWLEAPAAGADGAGRGLAAGAPDPAAGAWRAVIPVRPYATGPVRVRWVGGPDGGVIAVRGRLDATAAAAEVRDPRGLGWHLGRLAAVFAILVAAALLARRWRRRRRASLAVDRPLPPPAWMEAAVALWRLEGEDLPARGEGRRFLDRLAGILRAYLAGAYHLPACESTAGELAAAAARSGWPAEPLGGLVALVAAADRDRFAPAAVSRDRCTGDLARAVALVAAGHFAPRHSPVPAGLRAEAEDAWRQLCRRHRPSAPGEAAA